MGISLALDLVPIQIGAATEPLVTPNETMASLI